MGGGGSVFKVISYHSTMMLFSSLATFVFVSSVKSTVSLAEDPLGCQLRGLKDSTCFDYLFAPMSCYLTIISDSSADDGNLGQV